MSSKQSGGIPRYFGTLSGVVRSYAWGKVGRTSRIYSFLDRAGQSIGSEPLAEYWLGAHPSAPSTLTTFDGVGAGLNEVIGSDPRGTAGADAIGQEEMPLPFLLKVLSINPHFGLSIQAHPDKELAQQLRIRDPQNYPDSNHKPEVGLALSPVVLLYGFRSVHEIAQSFSLYPELRSVFSESTSTLLVESCKADSSELFLRALYRELLTASPAVVAACVHALANRFTRFPNAPVEIDILTRLRDCYGESDVGLLALFFMNIVTVHPGEALFIGPNVPHAYLDGDLIECMACSDNVVRAGLTPKFKDVKTLLEMVDYHSSVPSIITPREGDIPGFLEVQAPAAEFSLSFARSGAEPLSLWAGKGPRIVLCLGTRAVVRHVASGHEIVLRDGGAVFLPPGEDEYRIERHEAAIYVASKGKQ